MIKAIIFDIGGVVIDYKSVSLAFRKNFNLTMPDQKVVPKSMTPNYLRGKIPMNKIYSVVGRRFNEPVSEVKRKIFRSYNGMKPIKGMYELLDRLKKISNIRLAALSNATKPTVMINRKFKRYRWFKPVILSCEVGMRKPDRRIFYLTLKKLRLDSEECIFIDDRKDHVQVAKKIGFNAVQFKNASQLKKDLIKYGVKI